MTPTTFTCFLHRFVATVLGCFLLVIALSSSLGIAGQAVASPDGTGAGGAAANAGSANNGGGNGGLSAFNLFDFECLFPIEGCPEGKALTDSIFDALVGLAPVLATLVFIWGGYQYFFGGITGKQNGLNAIKSAVIGLLLVLSANFIINDFLPRLIQDGNINTQPIAQIIRSIADALIQIAVAVAVVVIIYGGYQYMFTGIAGKENGRKTIINGVIGLAIILSASAITGLVENFLVLDIFDNVVASTDSLGVRIADIIVAVTNNILIPVAAAVTVFFVVLAGYKWISSPSIVRAADAKQALINALIGFIIVLLAVTIVQLIYYFVPNFVESV